MRDESCRLFCCAILSNLKEPDTPIYRPAMDQSSGNSDYATLVEGGEMDTETSENELASNTLLITNLPEAFFGENPEMQLRLKELAESFGFVHHFLPLKTLGRRVLVVFDDVEAAIQAKAGLQALAAESAHSAEERIRVYFGAHTPLEPSIGLGAAITSTSATPGHLSSPIHDPNPPAQYLAVPLNDKNFLISPPGSPPLDWAQSQEDGPNPGGIQDLREAMQELERLSLGDGWSLGQPAISTTDILTATAPHVGSSLGENEHGRMERQLLNSTGKENGDNDLHVDMSQSFRISSQESLASTLPTIIITPTFINDSEVQHTTSFESPPIYSNIKIEHAPGKFKITHMHTGNEWEFDHIIEEDTQRMIHGYIPRTRMPGRS